MDNMISRISEILDDPVQAEKIKQIAASMMSGGSAAGEPAENSEDQTEAPGETAITVPREEGRVSVGGFEKYFSPSKSSRSITLLNAIKPYMRTSRAEKIVSAVKAMEMIELISKLK